MDESQYKQEKQNAESAARNGSDYWSGNHTLNTHYREQKSKHESRTYNTDWMDNIAIPLSHSSPSISPEERIKYKLMYAKYRPKVRIWLTSITLIFAGYLLVDFVDRNQYIVYWKTYNSKNVRVINPSILFFGMSILTWLIAVFLRSRNRELFNTSRRVFFFLSHFLYCSVLYYALVLNQKGILSKGFSYISYQTETTVNSESYIFLGLLLAFFISTWIYIRISRTKKGVDTITENLPAD